ncbi:TPA: hypothetical protein G8M05_005423 [Salmonella enterica]|nr:hypothetical protein [Salmonella enterica]
MHTDGTQFRHAGPAEYRPWLCCKVSDQLTFGLIQKPYISKIRLTRRISPRGSP